MLDINWGITFEITVNGEDKNFDDLSEQAQENIINMIRDGSYGGTFID